MSESLSAFGFLVQTPCGPRKSGMPESVEIPAPVRTTMRWAEVSQRGVGGIGGRRTSIGLGMMARGVLCVQGDPIVKVRQGPLRPRRPAVSQLPGRVEGKKKRRAGARLSVGDPE